VKTERMTILVTPEQKAAITARAESLGLSAGEMLRRAAETYSSDAKPGSEDLLNALADELFAAAKSARAALSSANKEVRTTLRQLQKRRLSHGRV
jgi:hypothetical protein